MTRRIFRAAALLLPLGLLALAGCGSITPFQDRYAGETCSPTCVTTPRPLLWPPARLLHKPAMPVVVKWDGGLDGMSEPPTAQACIIHLPEVPETSERYVDIRRVIETAWCNSPRPAFDPNDDLSRSHWSTVFRTDGWGPDSNWASDAEVRRYCALIGGCPPRPPLDSGAAWSAAKP